MQRQSDALHVLAQTEEEHAPDVKITKISINIEPLVCQTAAEAHPWVISNTPAKFEFNLTNSFCEMQGTDGQRFFAFIQA